MKRMVSVCLAVIIALSGCGHNQATDSSDKSVPASLAPSAHVEPVELAQRLSLKDTQDFVVLDYWDDMALILVSNPAQRNELDINDQLVTTYYESFVLFDLSAGAVAQQYPLERFGICKSALSVFDGVLFSFFTVTPAGEMQFSICFLDGQGVHSVYQSGQSAFGMGPVLRRFEQAVLFSFYDDVDASFGVKKINADFTVEPVLSFDGEEVDYAADELKVAESRYAYMVGEADCATFYIGGGGQPPVRVALEAGQQIYGFDINQDTLVVSIAAGPPFLFETFDLHTGEGKGQLTVPLPLYSLSVNGQMQMCGFYYSTLKLYELGNDVMQEISLDTIVQGSFYDIFLSGNQFLVVIYSFDALPKLWLLPMK